jgi:hypothetical protein
MLQREMRSSARCEFRNMVLNHCAILRALSLPRRSRDWYCIHTILLLMKYIIGTGLIRLTEFTKI